MKISIFVCVLCSIHVHMSALYSMHCMCGMCICMYVLCVCMFSTCAYDVL